MSMKNNYNQIKELLSAEGLIHSLYPSMAEIMQKVKSGKKLKILYGETYDKYGLTIDSLKYYFFISLLHKLLEEFGLTVNSYVIVGDTHSVKNKIVKDKDSLLADAAIRLKRLKVIQKIYGLSFKPILMSEAYKQKDFKTKLKKIKPIFEKSTKFKRMAEKTVLENRLSQENKLGFQYTIEEVALIMDYDLKIGPPREKHYDKIARLMGKELKSGSLSGVYLSPTYPLGLSFDYFVRNPEIEKYGLTPYKAGSNRLQNNRVIIGETNLDKLKDLIDKSFVSANPELPNPVLDLYSIAEMARVLLKGEGFDLNCKELLGDIDELKNRAFKHLKLFIYQPLQL